MIKRIFKYRTSFEDRFTIVMPKNAEILSVQIDKKDNAPYIWVLCNPINELEERYFEVYGTGHDIYCDMGIERKYIGTYQYQKGEFIGHLFERTN